MESGRDTYQIPYLLQPHPPIVPHHKIMRRLHRTLNPSIRLQKETLVERTRYQFIHAGPRHRVFIPPSIAFLSRKHVEPCMVSLRDDDRRELYFLVWKFYKGARFDLCNVDGA